MTIKYEQKKRSTHMGWPLSRYSVVLGVGKQIVEEGKEKLGLTPLDESQVPDTNGAAKKRNVLCNPLTNRI